MASEYAEIKGSRRTVDTATSRIGIELGVSDDLTGIPVAGVTFFASDSGIHGRICQEVRVEPEKLGGLYLITSIFRGTYVWSDPAQAPAP